MTKTMRLLTMAGMGLLAGATLAAGPAQAAPAAGQAKNTTTATTQGARWGSDEVVGYYRDFWSCEQAGRTGDRFGAWEDYDCVRVRVGFRGGAFALVVDDNDWDDRWDSRWRGGYWPSNWSYRPQWPGHHRGGDHRGPGGHRGGPGHFGNR
ncbi:hypothetical protein [Actinoplanes awajinensis]|uniref:Uncharacterized protein n=1 Tax=Actinoplanes awajinensis subsp. mycoplanecinus TaxID=135947 RepID=A0A101JPJ7_9ACTN|nr:hypothetical protein [Actinoplanes awajinensis]KUL30755.1 hypothetical protein ADL15_24220 [Actinoplanes awajinensis subsp. mycoplanecinus]